MDSTNLLPELDAQCLKLFQDYFEKYYVGENSVFPPKIWSGLMGKNEIRYTKNGKFSQYVQECIAAKTLY